MIGVGIDVGAARLHAVALDGATGQVVAADVLGATDPDAAVAWAVGHGAERLAIDAPSALVRPAHVDDGSLAPKFRLARCGEIALGRSSGVWVSWVAPEVGTTDPAPWMVAGLGLFAAAASAGIPAVETYPHAAFRALAGGLRVPGKSSSEGLARRAELLRAAGVAAVGLELWGHDGLDAAVAALVAAHPDPQVHTCGHDGSSLWLPPAPATPRSVL